MKKIVLAAVTLTAFGVVVKYRNKLNQAVGISMDNKSDTREQGCYPSIIVTKKNDDVLAVISEDDVIYHDSVNVYMNGELVD
ncbi:hypothetical protein [Pisciglobus halotolerans]|uniref:Uncharacterized protein n=1 Tax=Pisciglobus halotolerans TaxID=745365 RepID=A0A1I3C2P3_9LACT|nr:hypothetical protein [Pisciglobus halotolerans]SFH68824.1 hypothetical protein SAMN04489868_11256 [Pisciglobus halotolerans]